MQKSNLFESNGPSPRFDFALTTRHRQTAYATDVVNIPKMLGFSYPADSLSRIKEFTERI